MELKKYTNKTGLESLKNPTPLRNDAGPLSGLQRNALASCGVIVYLLHLGWTPVLLLFCS